jgi:tRNA(Ile)-lysidine synthetase-like protein
LYAIDYTNEENEHTRNRFRHYVIPFLKQENPNVHLKYKSFSEELKLYDDFIEKYIKNNCSEILVDNKIDIKKFQNEDILIQRKIVEKLLNNIYDGYLEVITKQHVEQILKLIDINITNKRIDLPDNYMAIIDYGYLKITKKINNENYNLIFKEDLELNSQKFCIVDNSLEKSNYVLRLNSNEIKLPLHIRSRKNGDKILVKNLNNYKKVSDILTDEKIDFQLREQILLVTDDDDNILWVPGIKKSNFDKEKNEICDIIVKYILIKEENNDYKK